MKRMTGIVGGLALAGSLGVGMATSASAATSSSDARISVASEQGASSSATCRYRLINRGVRVWCSAATPGTAFRAGAKCKRANGTTFWKNDIWRVQGTGYSQAVCPVGSKRMAIRAQYR
jgi:hypothetical protein